MAHTSYPFFIDEGLLAEVAFPFGLARHGLERAHGQIVALLSGASGRCESVSLL